jgi:nucleoside-diphosphate-sugar epimerase
MVLNLLLCFVFRAEREKRSTLTVKVLQSIETNLPMPNEQNERILIAGASGAIGRRLCLLLVADGWRVTGTTRSPEKAVALRRIGVEPIIVDVFDAERLRKVVVEAQPAIVIHQLTDLPPALDPAKMAEAIVRNARLREVGTRNLLAAAIAARATRMIAQSIAFAYAPGPLPYAEDAPLNVAGPDRAGLTARAVASLEQQVLDAPLAGIILRYGSLYGPGTGFDQPARGAPVQVDAAADAARRAITRGVPGIYNIAEDDGTVSSHKAAVELGWKPDFRIDEPALTG